MLASREQKERQDASPETPVGKKRKLGETHHDMPSYRPTGSLKSPSTSKKVKPSSSALLTTIPTSDAEEDELPDFSGTSRKPKSDDLVDCPLCNKRVAFKSINSHMDNGCKDLPSLSARSATADWQKLMSRPSKGKQKDNGSDDDEHPLAKAPYDTLKDKKLKEMLNEQGLPTNGDRNQLVQRHSRNRKSRDELRRELKRWEEDKSKKKKTTVDDTVAYQKQHQNEFARLIEAARPRGKKTEGTSTPASNSMKKIPLGGDALLKEKNAEGPENAIVLDSEEEELNFVQRA
ncbi:hypothetical protein H0H93_007211 [Arthromyces matolae]|nr:hypothetical protein H0H93_007211 [Arthromyces matolae]